MLREIIDVTGVCQDYYKKLLLTSPREKYKCRLMPE